MRCFPSACVFALILTGPGKATEQRSISAGSQPGEYHMLSYKMVLVFVK